MFEHRSGLTFLEKLGENVAGPKTNGIPRHEELTSYPSSKKDILLIIQATYVFVNEDHNAESFCTNYFYR